MTIHPDLHVDDTIHRRDLVAELRRIRIAAGMSTRAVAATLHAQPDTIRQFERHSQPNPHILTVQRYARALGHRADLTLHGIVAPPNADMRTLAACAGAIDPAIADPAARTLCITRLIAARRHQHLDRAELAERMGDRSRTVLQIDAERHEPLLATYQRYARALGGWLTVELRPVERRESRPGPNDLLPCPSRSARLRHLARAEHCDTCRVEGAVRLERVENAA